MSSTVRPPIITAGDRLGLTLFLAVALHALIILGISFQSPDAAPPPATRTLDVTLVHTRAEAPPEEADYYAQEDQSGGGNTTEQVQERSPTAIPSPQETPGTSMQAVPAAAPPEPAPDTTRISRAGEEGPATGEPRPAAPVEDPIPSMAELVQRSMEIARLSAQAESRWQAYAKRPDPKYLTAATRRSADAAYLHDWTRKVERIGNLNYPDAARREGLTGRLILDVAIRPDGSLADVALLRSSGHKVLDEAAIRIVRLAAPFAPVPAEVLGEKTELRIVRTWVFTSGNRLQGRR